jgi:hypothetical protein
MIPVDLCSLFLQQTAQSHSLSAENPTGARGAGAMAEPEGSSAARELGRGWKVQPCIKLKAGETASLMDHPGPGVIRHMWFTFSEQYYRDIILRIYWDHGERPSVEAPLADLLCNSWKTHQQILAQPVNVNPRGGMNLYFPMPFQKQARITVQNDSPQAMEYFFYTINYTLETLPSEILYFHAHWRRSNPLPYQEEYVILDGVQGRGHYVGTFMAWQQNNAGWWGEGEIKMFLDGDGEFPTVCGTGTEDYFGGAWGFGESYSAPYLGFQEVAKRSGEVGARMTLYRFHVLDPVYFESDIRVTMQALGWRSGQRYLPLQDDIASVAYWYQTLPPAPFAPLGDKDYREIV